MNCKDITTGKIKRLRCDDLLFVYKYFTFEESAEFCRNQRYQLANVKDGKVYDNKLNKFTNVIKGSYLVVFEFMNKNSV